MAHLCFGMLQNRVKKSQSVAIFVFPPDSILIQDVPTRRISLKLWEIAATCDSSNLEDTLSWNLKQLWFLFLDLFNWIISESKLHRGNWQHHQTQLICLSCFSSLFLGGRFSNISSKLKKPLKLKMISQNKHTQKKNILKSNVQKLALFSVNVWKEECSQVAAFDGIVNYEPLPWKKELDLNQFN